MGMTHLNIDSEPVPPLSEPKQDPAPKRFDNLAPESLEAMLALALANLRDGVSSPTLVAQAIMVAINARINTAIEAHLDFHARMQKALRP